MFSFEHTKRSRAFKTWSKSNEKTELDENTHNMRVNLQKEVVAFLLSITILQSKYRWRMKLLKLLPPSSGGSSILLFKTRHLTNHFRRMIFGPFVSWWFRVSIQFTICMWSEMRRRNMELKTQLSLTKEREFEVEIQTKKRTASLEMTIRDEVNRCEALKSKVRLRVALFFCCSSVSRFERLLSRMSVFSRILKN